MHASRFCLDDIEGKPLVLQQRPALHQTLAGSTGGTVWEASLVLAHYVKRLGREYWYGMRVAELGAGIGLVGAVACVLGADITFTELEPLLDMLHVNGTMLGKGRVPGMFGRADVQELTWGNAYAAGPPFDLLLAAEVTVDIFPADALRVSLLSMTRPGSILFLAHEDRGAAGRLFFTLIKDEFTIERIPDDELDPVFRQDDVELYKITRL